MQENKKVVLGQFFTKATVWVKDHIKNFIMNSGCTTVYDPFAGVGDLLLIAETFGIQKKVGLDIDSMLTWKYNDSLLHIPTEDNAIILTNPPYLTNYSASRKKMKASVEKYFSSSHYDDLYLIALDKMLDAQEFVVAIIPETFINSNYKRKNRLYSITILEENPFGDTDEPVVVVCFDGKEKDLHEVKVYKNERFVNTLGALEEMRLFPMKTVEMRFNVPSGWLGVRCVDTTNAKERLRFDFKENIDYDWEKGIKGSSRLLTLIEIDVPFEKREKFILTCNDVLNDLREKSQDVILSPFKGNMKGGTRRRRLDFVTCRAIMEKAYYQVMDSGIGD